MKVSLRDAILIGALLVAVVVGAFQMVRIRELNAERDRLSAASDERRERLVEAYGSVAATCGSLAATLQHSARALDDVPGSVEAVVNGLWALLPVTVCGGDWLVLVPAKDADHVTARAALDQIALAFMQAADKARARRDGEILPARSAAPPTNP
jgi:hypothetical protein